MESITRRFVLPAPDMFWRPRVEAGIAVYLVGTDLAFAAPDSPESAALEERGAPRVATIRFDQDRTERSYRAARLRAVAPEALLEHEPAAARRG